MRQTAAASTRRRLRFDPGWLVILAMAALLVILSAVLLSEPDDEPLSATSTASDGGRALARVLASSEGVDVVTVRTPEELRRLDVGAETTLFLPRANELTTSLADAVEHSARGAGRLVLLSPSQPVLDRLAIPLKQRAALPVAVAAECQAEDVAGDDSLASADVAYTLPAETPATTCFPSTSVFDGSADDDDDDDNDDDDDADADASHAYIALPASATAPETVVLGAQRALTNRGIASESHAGLGVRMLRHTDRVVWIMPDPHDESAAVRVNTPVPPWFLPSIAILLTSGLGLCLWRGRRLGRIVSEPLPVVVHAIETTAARGRLYQACGDAASALRVLQEDTLDDLRRTFDLPPGAGLLAVSRSAAQRLGRDAEEIHSLLTPLDTLHETELVERAAQLRRLRHEAHE